MGLYCQAGSKNGAGGANSNNLFSATGKNIKLWDLRRQLQQPTTMTQAVTEVSSLFSNYIRIHNELKRGKNFIFWRDFLRQTVHFPAKMDLFFPSFCALSMPHLICLKARVENIFYA